MNKTIFGFVEPSVIMTVVVSLIILVVGVFAFFVTTGAIDDTEISYGGTKCWDISSPSNPETLTGLPSNTISITSVTEYYDDGTSALIDPTDYVWSSGTPTQINVNVTGG